MSKHAINLEWRDYYCALEGIRRSGICNMFGACPYLMTLCDITDENLAREILISWMDNYSELSKMFGWND